MSLYKSQQKVLLKIMLKFSEYWFSKNFFLMLISHLQGHPRFPKRGRDHCHPQECCYLRDLHQLLKLPWFFLENLELYNLQFYNERFPKVFWQIVLSKDPIKVSLNCRPNSSICIQLWLDYIKGSNNYKRSGSTKQYFSQFTF